MGLSNTACPFYGSKALAKDADIVFAPYNYISDPLVRKTLPLDLKGAVLVIDEAHNLEDVCMASGSVDIDIIELNRKFFSP